MNAPDTTGEKEAVLLFSDLHYGSKFEGSDLFPGYSSEVAESNFRDMISWTISNCQSIGTKRLHFVSLGDVVDGTHLRIQHARETDRNFADQAVEAAKMISSGINDIIAAGIDVNFYGVPGNHSRLQAKYGSGDPSENMDIVIYEFIRMASPLLKSVSITSSWYLVEKILGHGVLMIHGDTVRGYANPARKVVEVAGNYQRANKMMSRREGTNTVDIEYCLCGHFHAAKMHSEMDMEIYINGAFPPTSEFVGMQLSKVERPRQTMLIFDERDGVVASLYKFFA